MAGWTRRLNGKVSRGITCGVRVLEGAGEMRGYWQGFLYLCAGRVYLILTGGPFEVGGRRVRAGPKGVFNAAGVLGNNLSLSLVRMGAAPLTFIEARNSLRC